MSVGLTVIPAIDLKGGKCVRLRQGKEEDATTYFDDPVEVAAEWRRQGAVRLHIVNLDGAFGRASAMNLDIVKRIAQMPGLVVEYGGGIRSMEEIAVVLDGGAAKVVLGTMVVEDPTRAAEAVRRFGREAIIVAVDAKGGRVAIRGWQEVTSMGVLDLARRFIKEGVAELLYTDIERDGMMTGPDLQTLSLIAREGIRVIASGGVAGVEDVAAIRALGEPGITGVIVGKALYEKRVTVAGLVAAARGEE